MNISLFPRLLVVVTSLFVLSSASHLYADDDAEIGHVPSAQRKPPTVNANVVGVSQGETIQTVARKVAALLSKVQTLQATLVVSKWDSKNNKRKYHDGVVELARGQGARATLKRKTDQDEYVVNPNEIWSVDYKAKEAQRIPTSIPLIGGTVSEALAINLESAIEWDSATLSGEETVSGEPCWVIDAKTPSKFNMVGLDPVQLRVWVAKRDGIIRVVNIPKEKDLFVEVSGVRLNENIDSGKFDYKPNKRMKVKNIFNF